MNTAQTTPLTSDGFSLIELLSTIGLAAILMALAVPQMPALWTQFELVGSSREIALTLQHARMKAVGTNAFYRVVFYGDGAYVLQFSADGSTFTDDETPRVLPAGIGFLGSLPQLTFNRLGTLASGGSITVTNFLHQTKTIGINVFGRITVS